MKSITNSCHINMIALWFLNLLFTPSGALLIQSMVITGLLLCISLIIQFSALHLVQNKNKPVSNTLAKWCTKMQIQLCCSSVQNYVIILFLTKRQMSVTLIWHSMSFKTWPCLTLILSLTTSVLNFTLCQPQLLIEPHVHHYCFSLWYLYNLHSCPSKFEIAAPSLCIHNIVWLYLYLHIIIIH